MNTFALILITTGVAIGTIASLWLLLKLASLAQNHYRKTVWKAALYIARERADLLEEVAEEFNLEPSVSTAIEVAPRRARSASIQTITRSELEQYAHRLEGALEEARQRWLGALNEARAWEDAAQRAERLRARYWNRIKRVIAAESADGDLWSALHPALARAASA